MNIISQLSFILFGVASRREMPTLTAVAVAFIVLCAIMHVVCFVKYPFAGEMQKRSFIAVMLLLEFSFLGYMIYAWVL